MTLPQLLTVFALGGGAGTLGVSLASAMVLIGLGVANAALSARLHAGYGDRARVFHIASTSMMILFAGLVTAAFANVTRPDVHKRLMVLATIATLPPAVARLFLVAKVGGEIIYERER